MPSNRKEFSEIKGKIEVYCVFPCTFMLKRNLIKIFSIWFGNAAVDKLNNRGKWFALEVLNLENKISALEDNIKKLEILPNPELKTKIDVGSEALSKLLTAAPNPSDGDNLFRKSFRIYCFKDKCVKQNAK